MRLKTLNKLKILFFGLPGAGKTTLAKDFADLIGGVHVNADEVRKKYEGHDIANWDFSNAGRIKQAERMRYISDGIMQAGKMPVVDFVWPTNETREIFEPNQFQTFTVFMDTIPESQYADTNTLFERPAPNYVDYHVQVWFNDTHEVLVPVVERYMQKQQNTLIGYIGRRTEESEVA